MKQSKRYLFIFLTLFLWSSVSNAYVLITSNSNKNIKWGSTDAMGTSGGTVNWSYNEGQLNTLFGSSYLTELNNAFNAWSNVADITFMNVADASDDGIHIQTSGIDGSFGVLAHAITSYSIIPGDSIFNIASALIEFDSGDSWKSGFGEPSTSFDIFQVLAHEIGHAIGIDHVELVEATALMNPFYTETGIRGLHADDIAAAQALYGLSAVPLPAAFWLFTAGLGLLISRGKYKTFQSH